MKIYNTSIELSKLQSSRFKTPKGNECLLIPLNQDGIFVSDKSGKVYLNISVIESDTKDKFGNDGSVSIQQSKEQRENKSEKVYVGNLKKVFDNSTVNEAISNNKEAVQQEYKDRAKGKSLEERMQDVKPDSYEDDSLPF
jgi:hypothetical protein